MTIIKNGLLLLCLIVTNEIFCQKIGINTNFASFGVKSQNDVLSPTLVRVDGGNTGLTTVVINSNQSNSSPIFIIGRDYFNRATMSANIANNSLDIRSGVQNFLTLRVNSINNFVGINSPSAPTQAQLMVNGTVKLGVNGTVLNTISKSVYNYDSPTIVANQTTTLILPISGALVGSVVSVSTDTALDPKLIIAYARVNTSNLVEVTITNISPTFAVDPPAMNYYVTIIN